MKEADGVKLDITHQVVMWVCFEGNKETWQARRTMWIGTSRLNDHD